MSDCEIFRLRSVKFAVCNFRETEQVLCVSHGEDVHTFFSSALCESGYVFL